MRTAVICASTPRRLPATAAALNQTSLVVGTQVGVAGVTALVGAAAIASYTASLPTGTDVASFVEVFHSFLLAIGTSEFGQIVGGLSTSTSAAYGAAFTAGVQSAMTAIGIASIVVAVICWLALAGSSTVNSIWDLRDERQPVA